MKDAITIWNSKFIALTKMEIETFRVDKWWFFFLGGRERERESTINYKKDSRFEEMETITQSGLTCWQEATSQSYQQMAELDCRWNRVTC